MFKILIKSLNLTNINYIFFATFFYLISCKNYYFPSRFEGTLIAVDSTIAIDSASFYIIRPYKEVVDKHMNEIIAYSEVDLIKGEPTGTLNNFVADLLLKECNETYLKDNVADISLLNYGGLRRSSLPKGIITIRDIFELMPFENKVVVVTINSDNFKLLVEHIINTPGTPFSGMELRVKEGKIKSIKVQGNEFLEGKNYRVVTTDYLAYSGNKMGFFLNPISIEQLHIKLRDLIINYLKEETKKGNKIYSKIDNRIIHE